MSVEKWRLDDCEALTRSGIVSRQLVWPKNSPQAQSTITEVTMAPGSVSERHSHKSSEQIWIVVQGEGALLLENGNTDVLRAGDIVRTPAGDVHGIVNSGNAPLVYFAVTTPPQDFTYAYKPPPSADNG